MIQPIYQKLSQFLYFFKIAQTTIRQNVITKLRFFYYISVLNRDRPRSIKTQILKWQYLFHNRLFLDFVLLLYSNMLISYYCAHTSVDLRQVNTKDAFTNMRGSRSTAKLPMECRVNTSLPFVKKIRSPPCCCAVLLDPPLLCYMCFVSSFYSDF